MVDGKVAFLENRCKLELVGGYLVMACLYGNAQLEGLYLQVFHECRHTCGYRAEIVVFELLVLRSLVPHERAACEQQVGTGRVKPFVNEEVLLLPS